MKFLLISILLLHLTPGFSQSQNSEKPDSRWLKGMYLQVGYGRYAFSKSDLHFSHGNDYDFTVHHAKAHDQPDFDGIYKSPLDVSIPQYNYRIGFYLNTKKTRAIELNYDHAKYVVDDNQVLHITGRMYNNNIDADTLIGRYFIHLEHTNGANFYHFNYVWLNRFGRGRRYHAFSYILKAGAGVVIPKTDLTLFGKQLDNKYKIAGYIISVEPCFRAYPTRHWFFELSGKTGFANYVNASTVEDGKVSHHFIYAGAVLSTGWDINF